MGCIVVIGWIRRFLLTILRPLTWLIGRITRPKTIITQEKYEDIMSILCVGDIILLRTKKRPTNWFIPGFWSHAAFHLGEGVTVDAAFPEVRESTLMELMLRADYIAVMRPKRFAYSELEKAADYAEQAIGKPYDFMFDPSNDALYCSELCWHALKHGKPAWTFRPEKKMGVFTVTPQDLRDSEHFTLLREYK